MVGHRKHPHRPREELSDQRVDLLVSAAFSWEIAAKYRIGKLPQAEVLVRTYQRHLNRFGAQRIPITDEHSLLAGTLEWQHRDPFDRMIAAQCMIGCLPLVSADAVFDVSPTSAPRSWSSCGASA